MSADQTLPPISSQTIALLQQSDDALSSSANNDLPPQYAIDMDSGILVAQDGPSGTIEELYNNEFEKGEISTYVVQSGDTISEIAEKFNVSVNTIRWQNGLKANTPIHSGDSLIILPVDGVRHIVMKGETLSNIASKFKGDIDEIIDYNNIDGPLVVGMEIIIPGGEPIEDIVKPPKEKEKVKIALKDKSKKNKKQNDDNESEDVQSGSSGHYINPLKGRGVLSQGYHGRFHAVDIATSIGTPVYASMSGRIVVANSGGFGGGYGTYIVIQHANGSSTLYGHMSGLVAHLGDQVNQGEQIGYSGNSGRSSGPHLHFEIRNGIKVPCVEFGLGMCYETGNS